MKNLRGDEAGWAGLRNWVVVSAVHKGRPVMEGVRRV